MSLKPRSFRLEPQYWTMLEEIKKREGFSSDAFALRKCIELLYEVKTDKELPESPAPPAPIPEAPKETSQKEAPEHFNYESFEPDCPFATYIPEKKKVHCTWSPRSEKVKEARSWMPSNRLVDPQVCENCFHGEKFGTFGSYQLWRSRIKEKEPKEEGSYSPSYKVNFPFHCELMQRWYQTEEDFTTKYCFGCPNERCPMRQSKE